MILEGAMTAIVTPMRDGQIDLASLASLTEWQIEAGIDVLVAAGTTGESPTLTQEELVAVVECVVKAAKGRAPVVAGAGANSTATAIALSSMVKEAGADALLQVTPYYNKPPQEGLFRHFEAIAASTDLPIILYNVPGRTACDMVTDTVARLAEIDNIVAIKEATGDPERATEIPAERGEEGT